MKNSVNIVVVGGGFAGVAAVKELLRAESEIKANITLVDRNSYHLFTPSLYEIATSEEPTVNIAVPFTEIFGDKVKYVTGNTDKINQSDHNLTVNGQTLKYDYLIICLGSEPAYYHIPGLQEHSFALKSLQDAITIKNKISNACCKENECKKKAQIIVGGGGFTGTELAAELLSYKDRLSKQKNLDPDCLEITIIQGSDRLLKELDNHVSKIATKRVSGSQVHLAFGGHIKEVTDTTVITDNGKSYPYDVILWTGGVQANSWAKINEFDVNKRGQINVNSFLQTTDAKIFAAGDIAGYVDPQTKKSAPNVAQIAEDQGRAAAKNVVNMILQKPLINYHLRHWGYIVPLKGRYAAAEFKENLHFDGFLGWVLQELVFLYYLLGIVGFFKAVKRWNKVLMDYDKNLADNTGQLTQLSPTTTLTQSAEEKD